MSRRIPALAFAADLVAVLVFAAVGRMSHDEPGSVLGLAGTAAPFALGVVAAWASPLVRARPAGFAAGGAVLVGAAGLGLLLRYAFTGSLPVSFAVVSVVALGVLLLGWRALSAAVAHGAEQRVR